MINVCLCDDDKYAIEVCRRQIESYAKENGLDVVVKTFSSGDQLLFHCEGNENFFDIMFLDIIMGGRDGIETAKALRKKGYKGIMIFLTSNKQYALKAFEAEPLNYILKEDIVGEKFYDSLTRAFASVQKAAQKRLIISANRSSHVVDLNDILYIESALKKIIIHTKGGVTEAVYTLDDTHKKIEEYGFLRCHKSFVVNARQIRSYNKNEIVMSNGAIVPIGRAYIEQFTKNFADFAANNVLLEK